MKKIKFALTLIFFFYGLNVISQDKKSTKTKEDKKSYYKKRAQEDAKFEQQYKAKTKKEEKQLWKEQKTYEKNLKERDKESYKAYMQGKRDASREHYNHCNHHCNHGYYYHNHAAYYYHYEYRRQPKSTIRTNVRVGLPRVRIGLF